MVKITIEADGQKQELTCQPGGFIFNTPRGLEELANGPVPFHIVGNLVAISPAPEFLQKVPIARLLKPETAAQEEPHGAAVPEV